MTTLTPTWPSGTYINKDGLVVRYGKGNQRDALVGKPTQYGVEQVLEATLTAARLPSHSVTGQFLGGYPNNAIPAGSLIKSAVIQVTTAEAAANSQTLDVGLVQADTAALTGAVTEIDANGLFSALAQSALDTVGESNTGAGSLIGTKLSVPGYLWVAVGTADFTTLVARLSVTYYAPDSNANNS